MAICIFCPRVLTKATKPEHILHNGLGGRKTTKRTICSACNNRFGGDIDRALVEQFAILRNLLQLRSGTGQPPPMIRKVKAGKEIINIESDGKLRLLGKPFTIVQGENGAKHLHIQGKSLREIETNIPHVAAALKISEENLREQLSRVEASFEERRPNPFHFGLSFGGTKAIRSAAKSCLVLWTTLVGNDEVKASRYDDARNFINGRHDRFLTTDTNLDSRMYEDNASLVEQYGPVFSLIYVRSNDVGCVVGHFTAFNLIGFEIVLAKAGAPPNRQIGLITNPITGDWSSDIASVLDLSFDWLSSPDYDNETMDRSRKRFDAIMTYQVTTGQQREIQRIIKDVLERHGLKEGDVIPKEMANSISQAIAHRVAHHSLGLPVKIPISANEIKATFAAKAKTLATPYPASALPYPAPNPSPPPPAAYPPSACPAPTPATPSPTRDR